MLRAVGRGLRRIFGNRHTQFCPDCRKRNAAALAFELSRVEKSSFVWCGCGELLTPIVFGNGENAEVVAVACLRCRATMRVSVGILIDPDSPETVR